MKEINFNWRHSSNRKVHQRAVNRVIRWVNETIERDELWRGRFFIRQYESRFIRYEDGSGNSFYVCFGSTTIKLRNTWICAFLLIKYLFMVV